MDLLVSIDLQSVYLPMDYSIDFPWGENMLVKNFGGIISIYYPYFIKVGMTNSDEDE